MKLLRCNFAAKTRKEKTKSHFQERTKLLHRQYAYLENVQNWYKQKQLRKTQQRTIKQTGNKQAIAEKRALKRPCNPQIVFQNWPALPHARTHAKVVLCRTNSYDHFTKTQESPWMQTIRLKGLRMDLANCAYLWKILTTFLFLNSRYPH